MEARPAQKDIQELEGWEARRGPILLEAPAAACFSGCHRPSLATGGKPSTREAKQGPIPFQTCNARRAQGLQLDNHQFPSQPLTRPLPRANSRRPLGAGGIRARHARRGTVTFGTGLGGGGRRSTKSAFNPSGMVLDSRWSKGKVEICGAFQVRPERAPPPPNGTNDNEPTDGALLDCCRGVHTPVMLVLLHSLCSPPRLSYVKLCGHTRNYRCFTYTHTIPQSR